MPDEIMPFLPFDDDANAIETPQKLPRPSAPGVLGEPFAYIGKGLTIGEFAAYVQAYDFGKTPPDYICLHHTANPSCLAAPYPGSLVWDDGEKNLTTQAVYDKRKRQLDSIQAYYASKGWVAGPHLFIDELYIWLFTPLYDVGVHAAQGNSYRNGGRLHYSIGIEVIGYYEREAWSPVLADQVGMAVALLRKRLGTFAYVDGPWVGKVGAHRMYNKPSCPGARIVPSYYLPVLQAAWNKLNGSGATRGPAPLVPDPARPAVDARFQTSWLASGGVWQANRLTPGYATGAAGPRADGKIYQAFERGVARLDDGGAVSWLRLDELHE